MLKQPDIIPVANNVYMLDEDYVYTWDVDRGRRRITVPRGFEYDGASIPRFLWTLSGLTPDGLHRAAALVHDWLYMYEGKLPPGSYQAALNDDGDWADVPSVWSRKQADKLFGHMMKQAGISRWKRRMMYRAVRMFGWTFWND